VNEKSSNFTHEVFSASETNERVITGSSYHAYEKLSEGCNQACSFSAIPSFKGKLHSSTLQSHEQGEIALVARGYG
ncbi:30S ribosomal protein S12 methylthiotransferase RimO, partial [Aliarcobacter butzleri]